MADADPPARPGGRFAGSALLLRIAVAVPLVVIALAAIWLGGIAFAVLVALGMGLVVWEWGSMHRVPLPWRLWSALAAVLTAGFAFTGKPLSALLFLAAVAVLALTFAFVMRAKYEFSLGGGLLYAGVPGIALIFLRQQTAGFELVLWVMGLVWATDILAFAAGRSIGGAKIWPAISPGKTWAGLLGGMAGAALFSAGLALWGDAAVEQAIALALLGAGLAVVAQAGDFFESWLKRRAGVKDSGTILPGHGGVMDRVDGLLPVAVLVAAVVLIWTVDVLPGFATGSRL